MVQIVPPALPASRRQPAVCEICGDFPSYEDRIVLVEDSLLDQTVSEGDSYRRHSVMDVHTMISRT